MSVDVALKLYVSLLCDVCFAEDFMKLLGIYIYDFVGTILKGVVEMIHTFESMSF